MISKKDLLKETGISYGQLYRWKRERLIPEEWFVKQASFTGQETFLPKEKILERIREILDLKDRYSLEELANRFSPERSMKEYSREFLESIKEINNKVLEVYVLVYNKINFTYIEIIYMIAISKCLKDFKICEDDICTVVNSVSSLEMKDLTILPRLLICSVNKNFFTLLKNEIGEVILDNNVIVIDDISLEEISNTIKYKFID